MHAQLGHEILQMGPNSVGRHVQMLGHVASPGTFGEANQDLPLALSQPGEQLAAALPRVRLCVAAAAAPPPYHRQAARSHLWRRRG